MVHKCTVIFLSLFQRCDSSQLFEEVWRTHFAQGVSCSRVHLNLALLIEQAWEKLREAKSCIRAQKTRDWTTDIRLNNSLHYTAWSLWHRYAMGWFTDTKILSRLDVRYFISWPSWDRCKPHFASLQSGVAQLVSFLNKRCHLGSLKTVEAGQAFEAGRGFAWSDDDKTFDSSQS